MPQITDGGMTPPDNALMYAITGEQAPATMAGTDEMAEATATVTALRRGLAALGSELATAAPESATDPARRPDRASARRIWARPWTLATAAAVVGVALAGGYAWTGSDPADNPDSRSLPGLVACAETIVMGNVTSVSSQGDRFAVTLDATRYLKPENGPKVFTAGDARLPLGGAGTAPARGERVLVVVHDAANGDVDLFTGTDIASEWAWMENALPDSRSIDPKECDGE
ncbi:hypothetical protein SAMN06264365_11330 [Actinoplanes regularis]|uniref:Uncharacterized protein n=2 Tax=Actinoplanes regularis TaxID=52697 RepID=A0A239D7M7_9ACTN|nr:hypothetical protein Are01nite_51750 [Actinoplanes regularis]SNS28330.1 hypothetical protein SAMN06264365_11330 [Actinoplanes regularis]